MRHTPEAGAVCGNSARTDLRGGRGVNLRPYRNNYLCNTWEKCLFYHPIPCGVAIPFFFTVSTVPVFGSRRCGLWCFTPNASAKRSAQRQPNKPWAICVCRRSAGFVTNFRIRTQRSHWQAKAGWSPANPFATVAARRNPAAQHTAMPWPGPAGWRRRWGLRESGPSRPTSRGRSSAI